MSFKKTVLIILDGWGHGDKNKSNAIYNAKTPYIDSLYKKYPNCELLTDGENVGLPNGQMGNSEVGHLNIGAGRTVYQDLARINISCEDNSISRIENLKKPFEFVKNNKKDLHLIGLVSDGGIHSHQNHLYKLCELANKHKINNVFIHAFTDGRDCDPRSGIENIKKLEKNLNGAQIATICGRYYAMDRDKRWERIKIAYDLMVNGIGDKSSNIKESMIDSYNNGVTDEFIKPIVSVDEKNNPIAKIRNGDAVICFNFRTDRCREITHVLTQGEIKDFGMKPLNLHFTTFTRYDDSFKNINVIYEKKPIKNTLGEVLEKNKKTQLRIAETEKYPHVTFFFSGGREKPFIGEERIIVESPKIATYNLQPEMSAYEITSKITEVFGTKEIDFVCLNFANPDMVGHTGDYKAIIKAVETVDNCLKVVVESGVKSDYAFVIMSDHGNADFTINKDGSPNTAHSMNPVPCFMINTPFDRVNDGKLGDIAPTILKIMGIEIPIDMTGNNLIN